MEFTVAGYWQAPTGRVDSDPWIVLYTGAVKDPASGIIRQPAVRMYLLLPNPPVDTDVMPLVGIFDAPLDANAGPLTIVAVTDNVVELMADDGSRLTFDLESHTYHLSLVAG
jgi:hypothetical protein